VRGPRPTDGKSAPPARFCFRLPTKPSWPWSGCSTVQAALFSLAKAIGADPAEAVLPELVLGRGSLFFLVDSGLSLLMRNPSSTLGRWVAQRVQTASSARWACASWSITPTPFSTPRCGSAPGGASEATQTEPRTTWPPGHNFSGERVLCCLTMSHRRAGQEGRRRHIFTRSDRFSPRAHQRRLDEPFSSGKPVFVSLRRGRWGYVCLFVLCVSV
jgi:hypothetical protein